MIGMGSDRSLGYAGSMSGREARCGNLAIHRVTLGGGAVMVCFAAIR